MKKYDSIEDLAKAFGGFAGHFRKAAAHHDGLAKVAEEKAAKHDSVAKAHADHSAFLKAKEEGADDGDAMKAYFGKASELHKAKAEHHEAMAASTREIAKLHKARGAEHAEFADALDGGGDGKAKKAAAAAGASKNAPVSGGGDAIENMIETTMQAVLAKSLEAIETSGKIEEMVEMLVLKRVNERLGNAPEPTLARGVLPDSRERLTLVPRPGGKAVDTDGTDVEMKRLVGA